MLSEAANFAVHFANELVMLASGSIGLVMLLKKAEKNRFRFKKTL